MTCEPSGSDKYVGIMGANIESFFVSNTTMQIIVAAAVIILHKLLLKVLYCSRLPKGVKVRLIAELAFPRFELGHLLLMYESVMTSSIITLAVPSAHIATRIAAGAVIFLVNAFVLYLCLNVRKQQAANGALVWKGSNYESRLRARLGGSKSKSRVHKYLIDPPLLMLINKLGADPKDEEQEGDTKDEEKADLKGEGKADLEGEGEAGASRRPGGGQARRRLLPWKQRAKTKSVPRPPDPGGAASLSETASQAAGSKDLATAAETEPALAAAEAAPALALPVGAAEAAAPPAAAEAATSPVATEAAPAAADPAAPNRVEFITKVTKRVTGHAGNLLNGQAAEDLKSAVATHIIERILSRLGRKGQPPEEIRGEWKERDAEDLRHKEFMHGYSELFEAYSGSNALFFAWKTFAKELIRVLLLALLSGVPQQMLMLVLTLGDLALVMWRQPLRDVSPHS